MGLKLPPSCGRPIICSILGHFSSKASLFTGFWLAWVGKPRFFAHQMASHIDPARSAVELRSMHNLRRFGQILLQSLAIYRLLASSGCVRCIIYGVLGHGCSKASLFTGFWLAWVRKARFFTHQMASHIDAPRSAVELRSILRSMHYLRRFGSLLLQSLAIYRLLASLGKESSVFYAPDGLSY